MKQDEHARLKAFDATDEAQLSEFFRKNARLLSTMARRLAPPTLDPEDLLGDAVVALLTQYKKGAGPRTHVAAYVIQTMRNHAKDEMVSPRSKVQMNIDDVEIVADPSPHITQVELTRERALVRGAFEQLPRDHQAVLRETVVNGRKPRELSGELGRNPAAISALALRARRNLQRTLLQLVLEEGENPECRAVARDVPQVPPSVPPLRDSNGRPTHFVNCAACRRRWARWAGLPSLLTLVAVLSAHDILFGAVSPASAAETRTPRSRAKRRRGIAAVAVSSVALCGAAFFAAHWLETQPSQPEASVIVERELVTPGVVQYNVALDIKVDEWWPSRATVSGSAQIEEVQPPLGWSCEVSGRDAVCTTKEPRAAADSFTVIYGDKGTLPEFQLTLEAKTSDGAEITVTARGPASERQ